MSNPQEVAERIKTVAKANNTSIKTLLSDCSLGKNTVDKIANGTNIGFQSLEIIADYLGVSVDYLLGRTREQIREELLTGKNKKSAPNEGNTYDLSEIKKLDAEWDALLNELSDESLVQLRDYTNYLLWKQVQAVSDSP